MFGGRGERDEVESGEGGWKSRGNEIKEGTDFHTKQEKRKVIEKSKKDGTRRRRLALGETTKVASRRVGPRG